MDGRIWKMPRESRSPKGRLRSPDSVIPAWIATCQARGGSWRCLPMEMINATVPRCSSDSLAASAAPEPAGPALIGPRDALQDNDIARNWSCAWSWPTTVLTAPVLRTAVKIATMTAPRTTAARMSRRLRVVRDPPTVGRCDDGGVEDAGVGGGGHLGRAGLAGLA